MTFGGKPDHLSSEADGDSLSTSSPNYSSAVPVKWSPIIPNVSSNVDINAKDKYNLAVDVVNDYSKTDPLGIFPKRNHSENLGSLGDELLREKYPQLFLANHLAQLKKNENYSNGLRKHHPNSVHSTKVSPTTPTFNYYGELL